MEVGSSSGKSNMSVQQAAEALSIFCQLTFTGPLRDRVQWRGRLSATHRLRDHHQLPQRHWHIGRWRRPYRRHCNRFHVAVFSGAGTLLSEVECPHVKVRSSLFCWLWLYGRRSVDINFDGISIPLWCHVRGVQIQSLYRFLGLFLTNQFKSSLELSSRIIDVLFFLSREDVETL